MAGQRPALVRRGARQQDPESPLTTYRISSLPGGERDAAPVGVGVTWDQVRAFLLDSRACACTAATCAQGEFLRLSRTGRPAGCREKYGPAWTAAAYPAGVGRSKHGVASCQLLVLDFDHLTGAQVASVVDALRGVRWCGHGSHSDGLRGERALRVVVPLSEPVLGAAWDRFWSAAVDLLELPLRSKDNPGGLVDPSCSDASRLFFLPSHRADWRPVFDQGEGEPLDVAAVMRRADEMGLARPADPASRDAAAAHDLGPAGPAVIAEARRRLAAAGPAVEGAGGDQHTYSVCAALARGLALSDAELWPLLREWNATCSPPWDEDELAVKVINARAYGDGPLGGGRAEVRAGEDVAELLGVDVVEPPRQALDEYPADLLDVIAASPRGSAPAPLPDPVAAGPEGSWERDMAEARRDVARVLEGGDGEDAAAAVPLFVSAASMFRGPDEPTRWLVRGLVVDGGVMVVATEPKAAKTWTLTEMAIAVATGTRAFGAPGDDALPERDRQGFPAMPGTVCYFYAEDLRASIRNRLRALCAGRGLDASQCLDRLHVQPRGREVDVTRDEDLSRLVASARRAARLTGPVRLLCLDPLRNVHAGKENESDDMSAVMRRLRVLGTILGCTVAIVHHAAKASKDNAGRRPGQKMRGSGAVYGSIDSGLYLDDLEVSDDRCRFTNTVESEVKAARSAGKFRLELAIRDDSNGEAERATWKVGRPGAGGLSAGQGSAEVAARSAVDDAVALVAHMALVESRQQRAGTIKDIRDAMKMGKPALLCAVEAAASRGWIQRGPGERWLLTDEGRATAAGE